MQKDPIVGKERIQNFLDTGKLDYTYKNELDKTCFQHDMAYNFKDLIKSLIKF